MDWERFKAAHRPPPIPVDYFQQLDDATPDRGSDEGGGWLADNEPYTLDESQRYLWVEIVEADPSPPTGEANYRFNEVTNIEGAADDTVDLPDGVDSPTGVFNLREVNGNQGVAVGTVVQIWPSDHEIDGLGVGETWQFSCPAPPATGGGVVVKCTSATADFQGYYPGQIATWGYDLAWHYGEAVRLRMVNSEVPTVDHLYDCVPSGVFPDVYTPAVDEWVILQRQYVPETGDHTRYGGNYIIVEMGLGLRLDPDGATGVPRLSVQYATYGLSPQPAQPGTVSTVDQTFAGYKGFQSLSAAGSVYLNQHGPGGGNLGGLWFMSVTDETPVLPPHLVGGAPPGYMAAIHATIASGAGAIYLNTVDGAYFALSLANAAFTVGNSGYLSINGFAGIGTPAAPATIAGGAQVRGGLVVGGGSVGLTGSFGG